MIQLFDKKGRQMPATEIRVEPTRISQIRTKAVDGYQAIQLAVKKGKKQEFRILTNQSEAKELKKGQKLNREAFSEAKSLNVSGFSKGKGFQGVIKKYNFSRGPKSHGSHHYRRTGAIGQCAIPARVFKGKKMPGRMGNQKVTIKNLQVIKQEKDSIYLKGGVPGPKGSFLALRGVR